MRATIDEVAAAIEADARRRDTISVNGEKCGPNRLRVRYSSGFYAPDRYGLMDVDEALQLIKDHGAAWHQFTTGFNLWVKRSGGCYEFDVRNLETGL